MRPKERGNSGTLDHVDPAVREDEGVEPALVVAFPVSTAVVVPPSSEAAGRDWFAAHGIVDRKISSSHLHFVRRARSMAVRDAGARNGTFVDGRRLDPGETCELADGALVRVGGTLLVYRERFEGPREPSPPLGALVGPYGLRGVARSLVALAQRRPATVLIDGDTGTGKELMARAVAAALGRAEPYVAVNVAGVAAGVFESQMFGHTAGAFSDARQAARGVFVAHDGGTVFLDELGELPSTLQPKLLRLIENRELLPVGSERPVVVDVLIVAATNRDLDKLVEDGTFRRDLMARIAPARLRMPALRERREDIFVLARHLANKDGHAFAPTDCEVEAVEQLLLAKWADNVRGLTTALLAIHDLDPQPGLRHWAVSKVLPDERASGKVDVGPSEPLTDERVAETLERMSGNEAQAARELGVSRGKLRRFLGKS